jgi:hypothetical protein
VNTVVAEQSTAFALQIGSLALRSPVVLAPMAGVTNVAFRTLCRELELQRAGTVSGLYVCEMVTARALVERHPVTLHMTTFGPDESPRSLMGHWFYIFIYSWGGYWSCSCKRWGRYIIS